jgi:hypothetical protein
MADIVRRVECYYTEIPDRPGEAAKVLDALKVAGVNLVACIGFPISTRRAELDFVPSNPRAFLVAARQAGIKVEGPEVAFLIQGEDRVGAFADVLTKLGKARIGVVAMKSVAAGRRRYGAILWVKPRYVARAAEILGAS